MLTDSDDAPEIQACLAVAGRFDPQRLSDLLGVEPDKVTRAGELLRSGKPSERDYWHFHTPKRRDWDWPGHVETLLAAIRPNREEFKRFCAAEGLEPAVHLVAYMEGGTPIGSFSGATIRELADLGCALDVDLYCWSPEEAHG